MSGRSGEERSPVAWLFLSWCIPFVGAILWYKMFFEEMNEFTDSEDNWIVWGIIIPICVPYAGHLLAFMKASESLSEGWKQVGKPEKAPEKVLLMVLGLLFFPASVYIAQASMNDLWKAGGGVAAPAHGAHVPPGQIPPSY